MDLRCEVRVSVQEQGEEKLAGYQLTTWRLRKTMPWPEVHGQLLVQVYTNESSIGFPSLRGQAV